MRSSDEMAREAANLGNARPYRDISGLESRCLAVMDDWLLSGLLASAATEKKIDDGDEFEEHF